jgi:hypothetical protein
VRAKRIHSAPPSPPDGEEHPPDATGLTIDWIGVQATGGGGAGILPAWLVAGLTAARGVPFLARRAAARLTGRRSPAGDPGEPSRRP